MLVGRGLWLNNVGEVGRAGVSHTRVYSRFARAQAGGLSDRGFRF